MFRFRRLRRFAPLVFAIAFASWTASGARAQTGVWRQILLPGAGANAVAAGDSGSVLAVSTAGLFRYDGLRVRRVPIFSAREDSMDGTAVLRARNGDVWFGTSDQGLFRLRPDGRVDRYTRENGIGNNSDDWILDLAETPDGGIWAGTNQGGLSRFDGLAWTTLTTDQGMPSMTAKCLVVDPRDGSLWVGTLGTQAGLVHVVAGAVVAVYDHFSQSITENVQSVLVTAHGEIWAGSESGIARLVGSTLEEIPTGNVPTALVEGSHGTIWFGTRSRGVGSLDVGEVSFVPSGPPSNSVLDLYRDDAGVLWVATTAGLARFEGAAWQSHSRLDDLPDGMSVFAALRDASVAARGDSIDGYGIVWAGGTQTPVSPTQSTKLVRRANGQLRAIGTEEGLPTGSVRSIVVADSGRVWVALATGVAGGLARVRPDGTVDRVPSGNEGFPAAPVVALAPAGNGEVWATTPTAAYLVRADGIVPVPGGAGELPNAPLVGVAVDEAGRPWFATGINPVAFDGRAPQGAVRFDPPNSSWLRLGLAQGLPSDTLSSVATAPNGDVWFGSTVGATRLRDGILRTFTIADGLNSNDVRSVAVAPDQTVWVATNVGIARFDGELWSNYNVADGLVGNDVIQITADSAGVIASCKLDGVSLLHPDPTPPRVEIVSGPPAATGASLVQFVVKGGDLDSDESRVRISHELVGRTPTPFQEDVDAIGLDLTDGDYVFRVRGKDRALNETVEPFEWRFTVDATPPRPVVTQPAFNAVVTDDMPVLGRVDDPRFAHYLVELRQEGAIAWDTLLVSPTLPPAGQPLFTWPSRTVDDGVWELRVGVEDSLGLIGYVQVSVIVDNLEPRANVTTPATIDHVTGGRVFTTGGEVELYVPPNAFAADRIVRIDPLPLSFPVDRPGGVRLLSGWIVRAGTEDALAKPATLSIRNPSPDPPAAGRAGVVNLAPSLPARSIARMVVTGTDTTFVPVGGAMSGDGLRVTASVSSLGTFVVGDGLFVAAGGGGVSALDCQPRVFSPRGGGFDTRTAISFQLGAPGEGAIKVYDRSGRLVKEVAENTSFFPGSNVVYWDGTDGDGEVVPSGLYTVAVRFDGKTTVRTVAVANR